jgi:hypothetical protein
MSRILTNVGLSIITARMKGSGDEPLHIGWGTGTGIILSINAALSAEDVSGGYARVEGTSSFETIDETNDTYVVTGTLTALAALTITEWGLFDAAVNGNLLCRELVPSGNVLAIGGSLTFVFKFQFVRGS